MLRVLATALIIFIISPRSTWPDAVGANYSSTCAPVPEGAVGLWQAELAGTEIINGNDGTLEGDASISPGFVGLGAFEFEGLGAIVIPSALELQLQEFTIMAWVNPDSVDGVIDIILNKEHPTNLSFTIIQYEIGIRGTDRSGQGSIPVGNLAFFLGGIAGQPDGMWGWVDGGGQIPLNTWTHVALTFNGTTVIAYIDGQDAATVSGLSGSITTTQGPLKIGARAGHVGGVPNEWFNGRIDDVVLFNRALSTSEISTIFAAGAVGFCSNTPTYPITWGHLKMYFSDSTRPLPLNTSGQPIRGGR